MARKYSGSIERNASRYRALLLIAQDGTCFYCDKPLSVDDATFDHLVPRSQGGGHHITNLVVSCNRCNYDKANYPLTDLGRQKAARVHERYAAIVAGTASTATKAD